jgi:hypothetical protein
VRMLLWKIVDLWDYLRYYRRGKIKFRVFDIGNKYNASASNGNLTVWNNYGSTPAQTKEMALFKLKSGINRVEKEKELVVKGDGFALYRKK